MKNALLVILSSVLVSSLTWVCSYPITVKIARPSGLRCSSNTTSGLTSSVTWPPFWESPWKSRTGRSTSYPRMLSPLRTPLLTITLTDGLSWLTPRCRAITGLCPPTAVVRNLTSRSSSLPWNRRLWVETWKELLLSDTPSFSWMPLSRSTPCLSPLSPNRSRREVLTTSSTLTRLLLTTTLTSSSSSPPRCLDPITLQKLVLRSLSLTSWSPKKVYRIRCSTLSSS